MTSRCAIGVLAVIATLAAAGWPAVGQTPKRGGILNAMLIEDPPGFSIHESSTISGVWPVAPCYSNLVIFDPLKPIESADTVIAELAERWSWQDTYRNLVFFLRKNVKWRDDKPFSSADVKYTFDVVREAKDAPAQAGAGPGKPLRLELTTRAIAIYVDLASFVADQLRQVGVEATVKQLDTAQSFPALARREFVIGANLTAGAFDDPDAYLFENYKCGTARNYTDYCSETMDQLIDQQSEEVDRAKRLKRVWEIQRKLEADVARPMLGWRTEYFTRWPHVKNLVPHNSLYNYARMQDVWLDR